jgi:hypothetical protein
MDSLFSTGATLAGPVALWTGLRAMRVRQLIQETPTSKIRSMAMGLVEINGKVSPRSRLNGPFSGRECAYWEIEIQVQSRDNRNNVRRWNTVHRDHSGNPFYIDDGTGLALVYPEGARVTTPFGVEESTNGFGVPEMYMQYMEQRNLHMRALWAMGSMRFRERVLDDGLIVYVLGRAYPRAQSKVVSFDEEALEATGTDAIGATRVRTRDEEVRGVIRQGTQDPAYLISPRSEKTMTFEYGLRAVGGLVGGPALTLFGVWCLLELAKSGQLFR